MSHKISVACVCKQCGKITYHRPSELRKYCSHRCALDAQAEAKRSLHVSRPCEQCGKIMTHPRWVMQRFCSKACVDQWKRAQGPELHTRFWAKVDKSDGCWLWTGRIGTDGYAKFWYNRQSIHASRVAYYLAYGPIPAGMLVCHRCDNPRCVRPDHLWLGDGKANAQDAIAKGRKPHGDRHWSRNHPEKVMRGEEWHAHHVGTLPFGADHPNAKLTENAVIDIRASHAAGAKIKILSAKYSVSIRTIWDVIIHKTWKHLP